MQQPMEDATSSVDGNSEFRDGNWLKSCTFQSATITEFNAQHNALLLYYFHQ